MAPVRLSAQSTSDPEAWVDRLLRLYPRLRRLPGPNGAQALVWSDRLLVADPDGGDAREALDSELGDRVEAVEHDGSPQLRARLKAGYAGADLGDLVRDLRGRERLRHLHIGPDHLLRGEPGYGGGPYDAVSAATELPAVEPHPTRRPVTVAVVDTGIVEHPWWARSDWYAGTAANDVDPLDAQPRDGAIDDEAGHGTFIAGIVLRYEPSARVRVERCLDGNGLCSEHRLVAALHHLRGKADVVNLSLGGYTFDDEASPHVAAAVSALARDAVVVAAAGNFANSSDPFWPAGLPDALAVGALDTAGTQKTAWSNDGAWVDAWAVGEAVHSTYVNRFGYQGFATWSGTSFAAPKVAGAIARRYATSAGDVRAARDAVLAAADEIPSVGLAVRDVG